MTWNECALNQPNQLATLRGRVSKLTLQVARGEEVLWDYIAFQLSGSYFYFIFFAVMVLVGD